MFDDMHALCALTILSVNIAMKLKFYRVQEWTSRIDDKYHDMTREPSQLMARDDLIVSSFCNVMTDCTCNWWSDRAVVRKSTAHGYS